MGQILTPPLGPSVAAAMITGAGGSAPRTLSAWFGGMGRSEAPARGNFWADDGAVYNYRLGGRLLIGAAVDTSDTRFGAQPNWGSYANWAPRDSDLAVMAARGGLAITGMSRTGDKAGASGLSSWGLGGLLINNGAGAFGRALYLDVQRESGAGGSPAAEFVVKNKGDNINATAYNVTTGADGIWLVAGGDNTYGGSPANPCNVALIVRAGPSKVGTDQAYTWNKGIIFADGGLAGDNTGDGIAIQMARRHTFEWLRPNGTRGAAIRSVVSNAGQGGLVEFADDYINFKSASDAVAAAVQPVLSGVNYLTLVGAITGSQPVIIASGADTNLYSVVQGKGSYGVILRDGAGASKIRVNTTGIGFNGTTEVAKPTLAAAATDAATTQALVNSIRTALINYGLAS